MAAYRLYTVLPRLVKFVDQLTNWYVRMNRKRLKGDTNVEDCIQALNTLFGVLYTMTRTMAPFIPFLTEHMYQNLRHVIDPESVKGQETASVHYVMLPEPQDSMIDTAIERAVARMQAVIELGRVIRDRKTMPMKYPLKEVVVIHKDEETLKDVRALENYIMEELNVRSVTTTSNKEKYGVQLKAQPDHKVLGLRLKGAKSQVVSQLDKLSDEQLVLFQKTGEMTVGGHVLGPEDLKVLYTFDTKSKDTPNCYEAHSDNDILVLLDVTPDQSMLDEGLAREVNNRIQKLRKKGNLLPSDDITVFYETSGNLAKIIPEFNDFIASTIKQPLAPYPVATGSEVIVEESTKVKSDQLKLTIVRGHVAQPSQSSNPSNGPGPVCRFVNVELLGTSPQAGAIGTKATVLLENPCGDFPLDHSGLLHQVKVIFGLQNRKVSLYRNKAQTSQVTSDSTADIFSLHSTTLFAFVN